MSWIRILFFALFIFLAASMFFNRILTRFGYTLRNGFIGIQIGLAVLVVFFHGVLMMGYRDALLFLGTCLVVSFFAELIGVKKGWIFGKYHYTKKSGPKLFGRVPLFIPLMWCVIVYIGLWTAKWLLFLSTHRDMGHRFVIALAASFIVTIWDMVADPLMVHEGAWHWEKPGKYYGVPVWNFIGWFFTAGIIYGIFILLGGRAPAIVPASLPISLLPMLGFCLLTFVFSRACFERRLIVPGIIGYAVTAMCVVTGCIVLWR